MMLYCCYLAYRGQYKAILFSSPNPLSTFLIIMVLDNSRKVALWDYKDIVDILSSLKDD